MRRKKASRPSFDSYEDFFVYYLQQHANPRTKLYHCFGLGAALLVILVAFYTGRYPLMFTAPFIGYGFAWFGHWRFEHNLPATFDYPLWSFISDVRMAFGLLARKIK